MTKQRYLTNMPLKAVVYAADSEVQGTGLSQCTAMVSACAIGQSMLRGAGLG